MKIFKLLRGRLVYRRVGPKMYQVNKKYSFGLRKLIIKHRRRKYNRPFDYDEKRNDQFRIF